MLSTVYIIVYESTYCRIYVRKLLSAYRAVLADRQFAFYSACQSHRSKGYTAGIGRYCNSVAVNPATLTKRWPNRTRAARDNKEAVLISWSLPDLIATRYRVYNPCPNPCPYLAKYSAISSVSFSCLQPHKISGTWFADWVRYLGPLILRATAEFVYYF